MSASNPRAERSGAAPEVLTLFSGELRGEVDCPVAIGASRMPAALFTTSDRVDPVIDDRVETVPPLRYVAARRAVPPVDEPYLPVERIGGTSTFGQLAWPCGWVINSKVGQC
jgi:hypothetical protein